MQGGSISGNNLHSGSQQLKSHDQEGDEVGLGHLHGQSISSMAASVDDVEGRDWQNLHLTHHTSDIYKKQSNTATLQSRVMHG